MLLLALADVEQIVRDASRSTHHRGALLSRRPFKSYSCKALAGRLADHSQLKSDFFSPANHLGVVEMRVGVGVERAVLLLTGV